MSTEFEACVAYSEHQDSGEAAQAISQQILEHLSGNSPDALLVFASTMHDQERLLGAIDELCRPKLMVGCASAGEFASRGMTTGGVSALALKSPRMQFSAGLGLGVSQDPEAAAEQVISSFQGTSSNTSHLYRSALVFADALAGHSDDFIKHLLRKTGATYQIAGGGAGDDANFKNTPVFCGPKTYSDAVVALEILSEEPIGIGGMHGWVTASSPMRVTESQGNRLISLNSMPAAEAFAEHAEATGQKFDSKDPIPFFLHNVVGIESGAGCSLRVPLAVLEDGSVICAAEVPESSLVYFMKTGASSTVEAAANAVRNAREQLSGREPKVAIFFDCVATRLRLGAAFGDELSCVEAELKGAPFIGCNTHGQFVRIQGQFHSFHNCTATVCIFPS